MNHRVTSQEQILEQAMQIAVREGVDRVSMRKLASACGIALGSVYNYYPNKEALITAVSEKFWNAILLDQEKLYRRGMRFTLFLEQYYNYLCGRLARYDKSWVAEMDQRAPQKEALRMLRQVLAEDAQVDRAIWNMELSEDAFCSYVWINLMALLRAGENNCRFFIFLLEHLLYDE